MDESDKGQRGERPVGFLILPGIGDSGPEHWQTHWERSWSRQGIRGTRVQARDWDHPERAEWVSALAAAVAQAPGRVVLVAHSIGCLQAAHWAATQATSLVPETVAGALLVAPPDPDGPAFPPTAMGFAPLPEGRLPFPSVLVASRDDPYASYAFSALWAARWGSVLVDEGCCGHINSQSGLGDWPAGHACLARLLCAPGG